MVVGVGDLGQRVVEALARSSLDRLIAAGRNAERVGAVAGQAALIATAHAGARRVDATVLDLEDVAATATTLTRLEPDLIVLAASRHTWWRVPPAAAALPYGAWVSFHVPLTRALMQARAAAGIAAPVVALPYPDAVGPILAAVGLAPELGAGNVAEVAAKLQVVAALRHQVERDAVDVRLIAHHSTERDAFAAFASLAGASTTPHGPPPVHAHVEIAGSRLSSGDARELFRTPYALGQGRETHALTAAVTAVTVEALLADVPRRVHVPAPGGRPGGYPARLSRAGVDLDLPPDLTEPEACAVNAVAARWDGIERIAADGTVTFTAGVADATEQSLGLRLEHVAVDEHDATAAELAARLDRLSGAAG
jgi:hypothetical protein